MTNDIDIDDLTQPRLNEAQRAALAWGETQPVDLSVEAVLAAARARTGLNDFGAEDFRERLALLCSEWDADKPLTGLHRGVLFGYLSRHASNRLLIHDTIRITRRSRARTSTARDRHRTATLRYDAPRQPAGRGLTLPLAAAVAVVRTRTSAGRGDAAGWHGPALRTVRGGLGGHETGDAAPGLHAPDGTGPHPRGTGADGAGFCIVQLRMAEHVPTLGRAPRGDRPDPHYRYLKRVLQLLQWQRGESGKRWVLKCPQHLEQLPALLEVFPDATWSYSRIGIRWR